MNHRWHTGILISCIAAAAVIQAIEQALSQSPHLAAKLPDLGWLSYIPLLLLIIAGLWWLAGLLFGWSHVKPNKQNGPAKPTYEKPSSKLVIHSANYGAVETGGETCDVGDFLRQIISGDSLMFSIETNNFDKESVPRGFLKSKEKRLQVTYSYEGSSPVTTERREHGRLLLPEDSKIQWLTGENRRLTSEVQRLTPAAPKIVKLSDRVVTEVAAEGYPLKLRIHLRNDSAFTADLQLHEYRPELVTVKGFPTEVLQIRLRDSWYPKDHGVGRIALYPGQQFEAWIAPDEGKFNKAQVEGYRGRIGAVILLVNGRNLEIKL